MTNPQPSWPTVDRLNAEQEPEPSIEEAGLTILPPGSGGLTTLFVLAALSLVAGLLFLFQNGIAPLVFGATLLVCGAITLTGGLVAAHIGSRLERR